MRDLRGAQNRNGLLDSRRQAQLGAREVRGPRKRFFGGPLLLPTPQVAPATTLQSQRLLLQSEQVAAELSLANVFAGPIK